MADSTPTDPAKGSLSRRRLLLAGLGGVGVLAGKAWLDARPLPPSAVRIAVEGDARVVTSNGVPDHETGTFPNPDCPLRLRAQRHVYRFPARPSPAAALRPIGFWEFGVALNGVPFDPAGPHFQGDPTTGWQFEVLSPVARPRLGIDDALAHVQPGGAYHYHGLAPALLRPGPGVGPGRMRLLGWAADGFPVYAPFAPRDARDPSSPLAPLRPSYRLRAGARGSGPGGRHDGTFVEDFEFVAGLGDLDEANGRVAVTPEFPGGTYHYVLTADFPFIPRFHRGTPDASFGAHAQGPGLAGVPPALRAYRAA
jgi:hypothetical protein